MHNINKIPDARVFQKIANQQIFNYFLTLFIRIWMATFKYNWPKTCRQFNFERAIMYEGRAMIFKAAETKEWYSLPFVAQGGISKIYGDPVDPAGVGVMDIQIQPKDDEYVIVYDNISRMPPIYTIETAAFQCYEIYMTYRYNMKYQRKPMMMVGPRNTHLTEEEIRLAIDNNEFFIKVNPKFDIDKSFKVLDLKVPYIGNNLLTDLNGVIGKFLEAAGCVTGPSKAERMNNGEIYSNERAARLMLADRLNMRREALEDLASRTDFSGTVEINDCPIDDFAISNDDLETLAKIGGEQK